MERVRWMWLCNKWRIGTLRRTWRSSRQSTMLTWDITDANWIDPSAVRDAVLLERKRVDKLSPSYERQPYEADRPLWEPSRPEVTPRRSGRVSSLQRPWLIMYFTEHLWTGSHVGPSPKFMFTQFSLFVQFCTFLGLRFFSFHFCREKARLWYTGN